MILPSDSDFGSFSSVISSSSPESSLCLLFFLLFLLSLALFELSLDASEELSEGAAFPLSQLCSVISTAAAAIACHSNYLTRFFRNHTTFKEGYSPCSKDLYQITPSKQHSCICAKLQMNGIEWSSTLHPYHGVSPHLLQPQSSFENI